MKSDRTAAHPAGPENGEEEEREGLFRLPLHDGGEDDRTRPTWQGLLIAMIAAAVLAVGATLLLGGYSGFGRQGPSAGCGPGSPCCPPSNAK